MSMAYLARCPRGHFVGVTVDNPDHIKYVAQDVARWIKQGCSVTHMDVEEARPLIDFSDEHQTECLGRKPRKAKGKAQEVLL